jgi:prostaglandin-H2 D-isomerase / glutathione transferase
MAKLKLTYFKFHGGRGEPARLALSIGGVDFEDERIAFDEFARRKSEFPFGAVPILQVDGRVVSQSNGINRYVGKLAGLYPSDPFEAALCDEAMDAVEDIGHKIQLTFDLPDAEKKSRRQALADGPITFYLTRLQQRLEARGGQHFAGGALSVADLKVFVWIRYLKSGNLEHVPTDLPDRVAPLLVEHYERVKNHPAVRAYYAKHGLSG